MGWRDRLADAIRGPLPMTGSGTASGRVMDEGVKDYSLGPAMAPMGYFDWNGDILKKDATVESLVGYSKASVAVYSCVRARASRLSTIPLRLYKVSDSGAKVEVKEGALYNLLKRVNPFWTRQRFMDATEQSLCYNGEAFWCLNRENRRKPPTELWWARSDCMRVVRNQGSRNYIDGYEFTAPYGQRVEFDPDEVIWIPYFNPTNEFKGLSPLHAAQLSIDTSIDAMTANRKFFRNGMNIGGTISPKEGQMPFGKDQAKQFEEDLHRRFAGVDKAHRWMVLSNAADVKSFGLSQKDAELLDLMMFTLNDVCRTFQTPPPIVQDFAKSTYNNVSEALRMFWTLCLIPEGQFIAEELTEKLLPLFPGEADICEADFSGVLELQENQSEVVDQMSKLLLMGVPLNPLLRLYKPDLIPLGTNGYAWGEQPLLMPGQPMPGKVDEAVRTMLVTPIKPKDGQARSLSEMFAEVKSLLAETKATVPEYGSAEHLAVMAAFEAGVAHLESKAAIDLEKMFKAQSLDLAERIGRQSIPEQPSKAASPPNEDDDDKWKALALLLLLLAYPGTEWNDWTVRVSLRLAPIVDESYRAGAEKAARDLGHTMPAAALLQKDIWTRERQTASAALINDTTWRQVQTAIADGLKADETIEQIVARVTLAMNARATSGAPVIAATEVLTAFNEGASQVYMASGVVETVAWLTRFDSKVRDAHRRLHGQLRAPGEKFEIPSGTYRGYTTRGPGQFGVADLDVMCRCWLVVSKKTEEPKQYTNGHSKDAKKLVMDSTR